MIDDVIQTFCTAAHQAMIRNLIFKASGGFLDLNLPTKLFFFTLLRYFLAVHRQILI